MKQSELIRFFEEFAPLSLALSWDNSGLQVASDKNKIKHLAIALDPCINSVQEAISLGADFILTHHPLYFSPISPNSLGAYHKVLSLLLSNNIALYSMHTNLDSLPLAHWLADKLKLKNREFLEITGEHQKKSAGIGTVGNLPKSIATTDFIKLLKEIIPHTDAFKAIGQAPESIKRVGICGGGGSSLIAKSNELGADIYISGDIKYHAALENIYQYYGEKKCFILDVGHFSLEYEMMKRLSQELAIKLKNLKISFINAKDPFSNIME